MIDDPFDYLTFGGTFGRSLEILFDRFDVFMAIAFIVMIPFSIIFITMIFFLISSIFNNSEPDIVGLIFQFLLYGIEIAIYGLVTVIGRGAITHAVTQIYIGQPLGWLQCLKVAWKRKCSLIGAALVVYGVFVVAVITAALGFFLLLHKYVNNFTIILSVVFGIAFLGCATYLYTGVLLTNSTVMVENFSNPIKGMKRSWELSTGSRCYLLCTMLCLFMLFQLVTAFLHNLFGAGSFYMVDSFIDLVIQLGSYVFYFPLHGIIETVLYLNLRIGRESMNHQVLSGDVMNDAPPASRFRNDDPTATEFSQESLDYRHVPLMDDDDGKEMVFPNTSVV